MREAATRDEAVFETVRGMPGHLLRRFQQIAVSMFLRECRDFDLTPLQFAAMAALRDSPPVDQATLGGMIALDRTTIGVVVGKLETRGLVARSVSDRDRRSKLVRLTADGAALLADVLPAVARVQQRLLEP
ncbi:MAG: MarR family transcriptional regulator, partial [Alphaproteobacteria bacterium]|nr:MarR family transcriptional regulator [Alphaproteobacteria bacterium]